MFTSSKNCECSIGSRAFATQTADAIPNRIVLYPLSSYHTVSDIPYDPCILTYAPYTSTITHNLNPQKHVFPLNRQNPVCIEIILPEITYCRYPSMNRTSSPTQGTNTRRTSKDSELRTSQVIRQCTSTKQAAVPDMNTPSPSLIDVEVSLFHELTWKSLCFLLFHESTYRMSSLTVSQVHSKSITQK